jgi:hypothetical protein
VVREDRLSFEATVARIARLAAGRGGTIAAGDVEQDILLARDRGATSAAGRLLASRTNVTAEPATDPSHWFPLAQLTFTRSPDDPGR